MKSFTTIVKLLAATTPLTLATPVDPTTTDLAATDNLTAAKYETVCPYDFCYKRFGYKCNSKGKMTKKKAFSGCRLGCYCRKKGMLTEGDEFVEEMFLGEQFEGFEEFDDDE